MENNHKFIKLSVNLLLLLLLKIEEERERKRIDYKIEKERVSNNKCEMW